ncbi:MAG: ATP-dependent DNA ligase [Acidimicrobiales bacterium]
MLWRDVVATSAAVAATPARSAKVAALAALLSRVAPEEIEAVVAVLAGQPRQGKIGIGRATLAAATGAAVPATEATLTVGDIDEAVTALKVLGGEGSGATRTRVLSSLVMRATEEEAFFLCRLLLGDLRQGALDGVVTDAVAQAAGVAPATLRRAVMRGGHLPHVSVVALTEGAPGLARFGLDVLRAVQPMLASTAATVGDALAMGCSSVEWKLDGARVQAHRRGNEVRLFTRSLHDVTDRLPALVALVRSLPGDCFVLDGEVIGVGDGERPDAFQDTMSRFSGGRPDLAVWWFDCLHAAGVDLLDEPLVVRRRALEALAGPRSVPAVLTDDAEVAQRFLDGAIAAGHEGVVVKGADSRYEAGRRGRAWLKVKPVRTVDLVVLAAEWGHGRRRGWLSNLHLGARRTDGTFVMVGKTFKGLTDDMLRWQTDHLLELETAREGIVVKVRPETVVEIALDGVQASTRYPGGVALRFARVRRYRPDKRPLEADLIDDVRAMLPERGARAPGGT